MSLRSEVPLSANAGHFRHLANVGGRFAKCFVL
jgi:hypothetical protein